MTNIGANTVANTRSNRVLLLLAATLVATMMTGTADARRGGSFGSRGSRTYAAPRPTQITPGYTPGMSRSMTPGSAAPRYGSTAQSPFGQAQNGQGYRPRFGFGSGLLAGVVTGGLIGSMFGHGMGGGYGMGSSGGGLLAMLIQLALIGGVIWFALRLFRGSRATSPATQPFTPAASVRNDFTARSPFGSAAAPTTGEIVIGAADQLAFETLLGELQDAFGHEDYARLRAITTPEIMSYLAEELSTNATQGRRNEVTATKLLDAEVSEAWREADTDYATIAMRYQSVDVMRDRTSGAILSGGSSTPTTTTETWTFVRPTGASAWKVSAIQEA